MLTVTGAGTVNLGTEALDLGIRPAPREGVNIGAGQLAGLVRVKGTLSSPEAGADAGGMLKAGASAGAALATGGLSLLAQALLNEAESDPHPCATALGEKPPPARKSASGEAGTRSSGTAATAASKAKDAAATAGKAAGDAAATVGKTVEGAAKSVGGALKKLFGD